MQGRGGVLGLFSLCRPTNTRRSPNVGTMLDQRRRRWSNIVPTLGERLLFAALDVSAGPVFFPVSSDDFRQNKQKVLNYRAQ